MKQKKRIGAAKSGNIQNILMEEALPTAVGFIAGGILTKQLTFLASNPMVGNAVKIVGGVLLASRGQGFLSGVGVGIAANGAANFALPMLQNAGIAGVGLLPPGQPSRYIAGLDTPDSGGGVNVRF